MAGCSSWSILAKLGRALVAVALSVRFVAPFTKPAVLASANTSLDIDWNEWDNISDAEWMESPNDISKDTGTNGGTLGTLEDLSSRYVFHFVGDSTTRRLAESFVSILTGQASPHFVVHERIDMSSGSLKVIFHWAPMCIDARSKIQASIDEIVAAQLRNGDARAIIITAFGVHNAHRLYGDQAGTLPRYTAPSSHDTFREEDAEAAALNVCEEVTSQLVHVANLTAGRSASANQEKLYSPGHRGLDVADEGDPKFGRPRGTWTGGGDVSLSIDDEGLPPLVFLLQNNHYFPGSEEDRFLEHLHDVQDRVVRQGAKDIARHGENAGVFVLDD
ncbi:unnamed protein product [Ectocarpus sp. CCAP 1310/34]|nr:unnamed protein product [Ectocarpus sp. CCAP 1310/34]